MPTLQVLQGPEGTLQIAAKLFNEEGKPTNKLGIYTE